MCITTVTELNFHPKCVVVLTLQMHLEENKGERREGHLMSIGSEPDHPKPGTKTKPKTKPRYKGGRRKKDKRKDTVMSY